MFRREVAPLSDSGSTFVRLTPEATRTLIKNLKRAIHMAEEDLTYYSDTEARVEIIVNTYGPDEFTIGIGSAEQWLTCMRFNGKQLQ